MLAACGILMALQQTMFLPVLPDLPALVNTSASNASWLITATLVTGAVGTPLIGRCADLFGKKRMMLLVLLVVVAASVLGALSNSLPVLLVARSLQGCGLSLIPVAMAAMRDVLPPRRVPNGVATMSASMAVGAAAGLPLSGMIVTFLDWHAIFWLVAMTGALLAAAVARTVPSSPSRGSEPFDRLGALMLAIILTSLMVPLSKGAQWGWTDLRTVLLTVFGILALAAWIPLEWRARAPLVDLRIAARVPVVLVNGCSLLIGFALFSNILLTTQLLQLPVETGFGAGLTVLQAGVALMPIALVGIVIAPVAAGAISRFGAHRVLLAAAVELAAAFAARVQLSREPWQILAGAVLVGIGLSFTIAAIPTLIMSMTPLAQSAAATGMSSLLQSVGTSTASATLAATSTTWTQPGASGTTPGLTAFITVFWIAACAALVAAALAFFIRPSVPNHSIAEARDIPSPATPRKT
nr:MFS transporter [Nocardia neocaledoniensis]